MRIAFTHNLRTTGHESEAEFDSPETVEIIRAALASLGHDVFPVDVSGPASRLVHRLEALAPTLIFNTAEGVRGRCREAFYPGLFEQMGLPYTGSDPFTCTVTLDKRLSKQWVAERGVPVPGGRLIERVASHRDLAALDVLPLPVIVKPNAEGSSKGIDARSVVRDRADLRPRVEEWLERYPEGVLVEEFIPGVDVTVPFIEGISPRTGGVLEPAGYRFGHASDEGSIYDYDRKNVAYDSVLVEVPAPLPEPVRRRLKRDARVVFEALGVRDFGRADFRVTAAGHSVFLEVNALPSLEPGASIYASAAVTGFASEPDVLDAIIRSAMRRHGIALPRRRRVVVGPSAVRPPRQLRVGLVYDLKRGDSSGDDDIEAEFDGPATIDAIEGAIAGQGHEVIRLEAGSALFDTLGRCRIDVAFNLAEGRRGRGRESLVPALLDLAGVPHTGSDATALAVTLDKGIAKRLVRTAGVRTADFAIFESPSARRPPSLEFPLIVKPVAEGSSKGIATGSVVRDDDALRQAVLGVVERYQQPALVEAYLPGREFTVGVLGHQRLRVLPPLEVVFHDAAGPNPVYGYREKFPENPEAPARVTFEVPANIEPRLQRLLARDARRAFRALGCRDVARFDFRLDAAGRPSFIECNPLPGLTPGFSDLCVIAEAAGLDHAALITAILAPAIRRARVGRRQRRAPQSAPRVESNHEQDDASPPA